MSIIGSSDNVFVISHDLYLTDLYKTVNFDGVDVSFFFKSSYFHTTEPYKQKRLKNTISNRKEELDSDALHVLKLHNNFRNMICYCLSKQGVENSISDTNQEVENLESGGEFKGGNLTNTCLVAAINNEYYLIPPNCRFFNYDVKHISNHVSEKFNLIVLDPPWWNKYIRRKRARNCDDGYKMMWNEELAEIPINSLLENDGLVAVWCTNSKTHIDDVKTKIFPKWGIEFVSEWFWLKVTRKGEPVTPYSAPNKKQPFERILFGCRKQRSLPVPDTGKLIISVPSALHSHKPPLSEILRPYLPFDPKGLEIFARYLLPNFTSYGNQVLKLQHLSFFTNHYSFCKFYAFVCTPLVVPLAWVACPDTDLLIIALL